MTDTANLIDRLEQFLPGLQNSNSQADAFEEIATDRAVQAFEALRSLYIAQKSAHEMALVYEQVFEATAWPDMQAGNVSANASKIMNYYAEALRWFEAAKLEAVA